MKTLNKQAGFSVVEVVLVLAVIAILAVVGIRVMGNSSNDKTETSTTTTSKSSIPEVKKTSDLDTAATTLDQNDPTTTNAADSASLDSDLSALN